MAVKKPAKKAAPKRAKSTARSKSYAGFSEDEKLAMKEYAQELKTAARRGPAASKENEEDVLAKIASMPEPDRSLAKRIHAIVKANAPALAPRLWYGMPAYAKDGKVLCYFQPASKFKARYGTFGFNDVANLDAGSVWPVAFAIKDLNAADESKIGALVKKAAR